jgi:hypothetical protein
VVVKEVSAADARDAAVRGEVTVQLRTDTRQKTVVKSSSSVVRVLVKKKRMGEGLKKFAPARVTILALSPL